MFELLLLIYIGLASVIVGVLLGIVLRVLKLALWVVRNVLILLWRFVRWTFLLAIASIRSRRSMAL